jgi:hypothetical protein
MKLNEILSDSFNAAEWEAKGYELPKYDIAAVAKKTHDEPTWVHFGAGNIFRAFPAAILNDALNTGKYDRGVIVAESFDYEIIDKAYRPYNNLSLLVSLQSNGTIEKKVIASITESLKADKQFADDWARLVQIFQAPFHTIRLDVLLEFMNLLACPNLTQRNIVQCGNDALNTYLLQLCKCNLILLAKPAPCSFHILYNV